MKRSGYAAMFLIVCLWSCGDIENRGIENKEVAEEIRNREIRHITQAQITEAAFKQGKYILETTEKALTATMQRAVQNESLVMAARNCDLQQLQAVKHLQNDYQAAIQRIRLKGPRKNQHLNEMETQLLEAYQYNTENKLPLESNVQKSGADYLLFTAPLTINDQVCLKCHGVIGQDVKTEDYSQLKASYQIDSLVNYALHQPIAILSVMLQKKEVIKAIGAK